MSGTLVVDFTGSLALIVLAWMVWGIWRTARRTPTRQRALAHVLGSIAGTALLGVVLPAVLMGALDPFQIWLIYPALTVGAAAGTVWRWPALETGNGVQGGLVITS